MGNFVNSYESYPPYHRHKVGDYTKRVSPEISGDETLLYTFIIDVSDHPNIHEDDNDYDISENSPNLSVTCETKRQMFDEKLTTECGNTRDITVFSAIVNSIESDLPVDSMLTLNFGFKHNNISLKSKQAVNGTSRISPGHPIQMSPLSADETAKSVRKEYIFESIPDIEIDIKNEPVYKNVRKREHISHYPFHHGIFFNANSYVPCYLTTFRPELSERFNTSDGSRINGYDMEVYETRSADGEVCINRITLEKLKMTLRQNLLNHIRYINFDTSTVEISYSEKDLLDHCTKMKREGKPVKRFTVKMSLSLRWVTSYRDRQLYINDAPRIQKDIISTFDG